MKNILLVVIMLCSIQTLAQKATVNDSLAYEAALKSFQILEQRAQDAKNNLGVDSTREKAKVDSVEHTNATDSVKKSSQESLKKRMDSLKTDAQIKEQEARNAAILVIKMHPNQVKYHPVASGWIVGILVLLFVFGAVVVVMSILFESQKVNPFNLNEALSENIDSKITVANPEYTADKLKEWLPYFQGNDKQMKEAAVAAAKENADKAAAALTEANTNLATAQKAIEGNPTPTAEQTKTVSDAQNAQTEAQKSKVDTEAILNAANVALQTASNVTTTNPMVIANLNKLFPQTIEKTLQDAQGNPIYRPSASRLIALFSGIALIVIVLAMVCFYIYYYLSVGFPPDLQGLSAVLIALGFGMAPYLVNKVANAATNKTV